MNKTLNFVAGLFLIAIVGSGCACHPTTISFMPEGRGPLSSIKPITIFVNIDDQRPIIERDSVLTMTALIGGTDTWCTKKPVPLIVQDAFVSEFSKCGHRVVTNSTISVDANVKVELKRFRAYFSKTGASEAEVDAEISVSYRGKSKSTPPFRITGNYQRKVDLFRKGPDTALSAALEEFIHNLTFDPRLVDSLQ